MRTNAAKRRRAAPATEATAAPAKPWPLFRVADLADAPLMLTLPEVAAIYRQGISTVRKRCAAGSFRPRPHERNPYRWRKVDIEADLLNRDKRRRPSDGDAVHATT